MTSRNRNFAILGIVAGAARAAAPVVPSSPRSPRSSASTCGRHRARLPGPPHAAGADRHAAGGRRRDQHDPQAHQLARRLRVGDPALGPRPDLGRPPGRAERRARDRAGGHHRAAPVLRLGAERARRPRPGLALRGYARRCSRPRRSPRSRSRRPRPRRAAGLRHDAARRPTRRTTRRAGRRYYLFGPDEIPIGPDSKPLRTGDYDPGSTCEEVLSDFDAGAGRRRRSTPRAPPALDELEALGSGGPPAGSRVIEVPKGIVVVEAEPVENQPAQIKRFFVLEDDSELNGTDIKNPKSNTDPQTNQPVVTMEFTDKGREAFARVTKRIAERGSKIIPPAGTPARAGLPALRDHPRQQDRLAGDDRLRLEPRGHRRAHRRADREHRRASRRRTTSRRACASARCRSSSSSSRTRRCRPRSASRRCDQGLIAGAVGLVLTILFLLIFYRVLGLVATGCAADLRGPAVRAGQADPDHAHAAGHRGNGAHLGGGRRREHRHVRAHQGGDARRADRSRPRSPPATRRR